MSNHDVFLGWVEKCDELCTGRVRETQANGKDNAKPYVEKTRSSAVRPALEDIKGECVDCPNSSWELHAGILKEGRGRLNPPACIAHLTAETHVIIGNAEPKLRDQKFLYLACFCGHKHVFIERMPLRCGANDLEEQQDMRDHIDRELKTLDPCQNVSCKI